MNSKLRKYAAGKPCQVRLAGICNNDTATTVLAHPRLAGITGVGMKAPDELGAWCCSACHDAIDRRSHTDLDRDYVVQAHYEGILRTQAALLREEVLVTVL